MQSINIQEPKGASRLTIKCQNINLFQLILQEGLSAQTPIIQGYLLTILWRFRVIKRKKYSLII